jgi:S-adenosylmethionine:tRNA ribosyltransferase-isomerase
MSDYRPYFYELPEERVAQRPVVPADMAKMLLVAKDGSQLQDEVFQSLPEHLTEDDLLVLNDTRVFPARLFGTLENDGIPIEVLLLKREGSCWRALGKPMKRFREGTILHFQEGIEAIIESREESSMLIRFSAMSQPLSDEVLERIGVMPIPPYIRKGRGDVQDKKDYQTIFAESPGSIAAPTASLHFTTSLLERVKKRCSVEFLSLHVGSASFLPVYREEDATPTLPGSEAFHVNEGTLARIWAHKKKGKRIVAVGTTVVRALETVARNPENSGETALFIAPGFQFLLVDGLITNFHQPGTTHLLLVEALLGRGRLEQVYQHALHNEYRFLSYGDGMFIV